MAAVTYTGTGKIADSDYKVVKWVGKTKGGQAVTIILKKAICRSNIDWTMAEKDDIVPAIEFEGVYSDTDLASGNRAEPWSVEYADGVSAGNGEIVLGAGKFYIGATAETATLVGLTRGGGKFTRELEIREINADDDPGAVEGRLDISTARAKLQMNMLQWLTKVADLYVGIAKG